MSILLSRCWRHQIGWSYCAASQTFVLMVWRNTKKKVIWSRTRCPARGVMVRWCDCCANGCRFDFHLADFLMFFFQAPLRCYLYGSSSQTFSDRVPFVGLIFSRCTTLKTPCSRKTLTQYHSIKSLANQPWHRCSMNKSVVRLGLGLGRLELLSGLALA